MNCSQLARFGVAIVSLSGFAGGVSAASPTPHISHPVYQLESASAQRFSSAAEALNKAFAAYCADGRNHPESVKKQWHQTMNAWMALQGQERGPSQALEQSWNIQFWPDKKNTTGRKMSALVEQQRDWTPEQISKQSVTVQGLGAIEWLLYDRASDLAANPATCDTGVAISGNLLINAAHIAKAWETNPWIQLDTQNWYAEYIAVLSNQLEYSMKKLSRPMAKIGHPRPYFSESWRSKSSMLNLKANVEALQALYLADGKGLDQLLRQRGKADLADSIKAQFEATLVAWPEQSSLFDLLQSREGYQSVLAQFNKLEQLKYLIHEEVAVELGVVIGFNATDGD
ncbi:imelysin family protein [Vibrio proteolyticus]